MPNKTRSLLYAQLSEQQKRVLKDPSCEIVLNDVFDSYTGPRDNLPFFQLALKDLRLAVASIRMGAALTVAFIRWSNGANRNSKRIFASVVSQLKNGFLPFLHQTNRSTVELASIGKDDIAQFLKWLTSTKLSINTQRRYYGAVRMLLEELKNHDETRTLLSGNLIFPNHPFPDAHHTTKTTERLDDVTFRQLIDACKAEIKEITASLCVAWNCFDSEIYTLPDESRKGRGRYHDIRAVWSWIHLHLKKNGGIVPSLDKLRMLNPDLRQAIIEIHGYAAAVRPFYPWVSDLFPFVVLQAIYSQANAGPLRSLQQDAIYEQEVLGTRRIVYKFVKNGGHIAYFGERDRRFRERDRFGGFGRCAVLIVDFLVSFGRVR
ncbi:hypothetical protein, partial [Paraburkholderia ultramafica]|uniref:hypothetical protein n=1 Tax=Paraburkholderia ultramafica TaxID=1544867 RepID=UPI001583D951